jgi:hypothetical protein
MVCNHPLRFPREEAMRRVYRYVGSAEIAQAVAGIPPGFLIHNHSDIVTWFNTTNQKMGRDGFVTATFVITVEDKLCIADRHSEHVACAAGKPVLSAGELTLELINQTFNVLSVTNQSTGYCPEPESWETVANALKNAGMNVPNGFNPSFKFRRCPKCSTINVIKENILECAICESDLPEAWNFE